MTDYTPTLPPEFAHLRVDVNDVRYKAAEAFARENGLTQQQFTALLGVEARGVVARQAASAQAPAARAPAPTPAAPSKAYAEMSFAEKLMLGEARKRGAP